MPSSVAQESISIHPALLQHPEPRSTRNQSFTREQILQQLHGKNVRIPDLGKLMTDWPKEQSPHVEAVNSKVLQIINT